MFILTFIFTNDDDDNGMYGKKNNPVDPQLLNKERTSHFGIPVFLKEVTLKLTWHFDSTKTGGCCDNKKHTDVIQLVFFLFFGVFFVCLFVCLFVFSLFL